LEASLKQAKLIKKKKPVDAIAVTYGPGLEMCLWEGISFAKNLAEKWGVPLIPTNHMEGHVLSVFGKHKGKFTIPKIETPAISLLVSGGHTQLVLIKKPMQYEIIGETLDDAVGEAFDKVARMLDLPYPGGPQISKLAEEARKHFKGLENFSGPRFSGSLPRPDHEKSSNPSYAKNFQQENRDPEKISFPITLPRPMLHSKDFNFSFSGLKTAVLYLVRDLVKKDPKVLENKEIKKAIALEFENAAIECLVKKTQKAVEKYGAKTLIVAGGVAANKHLRNEMKRVLGKKMKLLVPTQELSGDNSLMIGIAGYLNFIKNKKKVPKPSTIKATGNLRL
jgi:N6-L-threonylcarbamoyladenine synthase